MELHPRSHMYSLSFHGRNFALRSSNLSVVSHGRDFSRKKEMTKEGLSTSPSHEQTSLLVKTTDYKQLLGAHFLSMAFAAEENVIDGR